MSRGFCHQYTVKKVAQYSCVKILYPWSIASVKLHAERIREVRNSYFGHIKININIVCAGILNTYMKTIKDWGKSLNKPKITHHMCLCIIGAFLRP